MEPYIPTITFSENSKSARTRLKLNQKEYSVLVGLPLGQVAKHETGTIPPLIKVGQVVHQLKPQFPWLTVDIMAFGSFDEALEQYNLEQKISTSESEVVQSSNTDAEQRRKKLVKDTAQILANRDSMQKDIAEELANLF